MPEPRSALWQPFTPTGYRDRVGYHTIRSGDGVYVTDTTGRRLLDGTAGLWCVNVGHGRRDIAEAMRAQAAQLAYYSHFEYRTEPALALAERIASHTPPGLDHVFFTCSGSESVETAIKVARAWWARRGKPERHKILSRDLAYHGVGLGGTSLSGLAPMRTGFGTLLDDTTQIPHNHCLHCPFELERASCGLACAEALERRIEAEGPETVAAFFAEPAYGAAGAIPPPDGYLSAVAEICRRHGVLLVLDEVITGWGRLGDWFAAGRFGLEPDMITMAKGLTSGYAPLGAVAVRDAIFDAFVDPEARPVPELAHGFTYSGHPVSCAAGLANLDILEREDLPGHVRRLEADFHSALASLATLSPVREVRGIGLIAAVEYDAERGPGFARAVSEAAYERGLIVRPIRSSNAMSPPLVLTHAHVDELVSKLGDAIRASI